MAMRAPRFNTNKLSVYMIKPQITQLEDIVESTEPPVHIDGVGDFFHSPSNPNPPEWIRKFFGSTLNDELRILSSSAKGVLIVPIQDGDKLTHFAVTFGIGRFLLNPAPVRTRAFPDGISILEI